MNKQVSNKLAELKSKLGGYVMLMQYRYMNICVKAEPISMLSISVDIDGTSRSIEDVALIVMDQEDEKKMKVIAKDMEDIPQIGKGILFTHPEFKQEVKELLMDGQESKDVPLDQKMFYIELTMPEMDKKRHEDMTKLIKTLHGECSTKMEATHKLIAAEVAAMLLTGGTPEEAEEAAKAMDDVYNWHKDLMEKYTQAKTDEIDNAFANNQSKEKEEDNDNDNNITQSMKL